MPNIDERIVQLQFDNQDFEKNIRDTMRDLEEFEKSLEMKGASSGLDEVSKSISDLADDVDFLTHRFSVCGEMVHNFWMNVANKAISFVTGNVNKAKNALMDMSDLGQASAGMDKYEQKMANVKTIMNATGKSIEEVSQILDGLMFYSDETSYSFANMTTSLAQLTSAGGDVDKLVPMIEGIANATAFAGKGATEFSRAIYNLNQSYSAGSLKYMDWKSIDQAGVSSKQLKQTFIDTAIAMGKLTKESKTLDGKMLVNVSTFNETLSKNWADRDVMEAAFGKFAEFTETVKAATKGDLEAVEAAYKKAGKEVPKAVRDIVSAGGFSSGTTAIEAMSDDFDDISVKAFLAAQEAKTFSEAVAAIKDVVSSSWMTSYEYIFGNVEEATEVWSGLYEVLYEIVAVSGNLRNEMLKEWRSMGGREMLLETLAEAYNNLKEALGTVADAWREVFPKSSENMLMNFTKRFNAFVKSTKLSKQTLSQISNIIKAFATGLKTVTDIIGKASVVIKPIFQVLDGIMHQVLTFLSYISEFVTGTKKITQEFKILTPIMNGIKTVIGGILLVLGDLAIIAINTIDELLKMGIVQDILHYIGVGFDYIKSTAETAFQLIGAGVIGLINVLNSIREIGFKDTFKNLISGIQDVWDALLGKDKSTSIQTNGISTAIGATVSSAEESVSFIEKMVIRVQTASERISEALGFIGYVIAAGMTALFGDGTTFRQRMESVLLNLDEVIKAVDLSKMVAFGFAIAVGKIGVSMERLIMSTTGLVSAFANLINGANPFDFINTLKKGIIDFNKTLKAAVFGNNVVKFAVAVGILAASIVLLAGIPTGDLWEAVAVIAAAAAIIAIASAGIAYAASNMPDKFAMTGLAISMVGFAGIVASIAYLVKNIEEVAQSDKAFEAFAATIALIGEVIIGMVALMKIPDIGPGFDPFKFLAIISLGGAIKNMAIGIAATITAMKDIQDPSVIWRATGVVAAMMGLFALLMRSTKNLSLGSGLIMGAIILSIRQLGGLFQVLGSMNTQGAANCAMVIDSIGMVIGGIIAVSGLMLRNSKSIEAFSDMMGTVSLSILALGATVGIMSYVAMYDPTLLGEGLFGLALLFGAYVSFCRVMKSNASTITDAADSFKGFGRGLLMIVGALGVFTYLTKDNKAALDQALTILGTLTVVYGMMQWLMHLTQTNVTGREFDGMTAMAGAVLAIAAAAKLLENIDPIGLERAAGILFAVSAAFLVVSSLMNNKTFNGQGMLKAAASILLLALAVDTLIPAIAILAVFPVESVFSAALGVSVIMAAMGFLISSLGDKDSQITTAKLVGLVAMVGALSLFMGVLGYVMTPEAVKPVLWGAAAIALVMLSMGHMLETIGKIKDPKGLVGPVAALGALLLSLGGAIALVGHFSKDVGTALAGGAGILLSILMLSELVGVITKVKDVKTAAGVILSLTALVGVLGLVMGNLASYNAINVGTSAASVVGVLVVLGVLTKVLSTIDQSKMITAAGGLIAISVAVGIISLSLSELASTMGQITPGQMLEMVAGLLGVALGMTAILGVLGALSLILTPVGMGVAIIALASITAAFYAFSFALTALLPVAQEFCTSVFPAFSAMVTAVGVSIVNAVTGVTDAISGGFRSIISTFATGLNAVLTSIISFGIGLGMLPYDVIALGLITVGSALGYVSTLGPIMMAGGVMIAAGITALANAGSLAVPVVIEATNALLYFASVVSAIANSSTFEEIGAWIPKSLSEGILGSSGSAESACESLGSRIEEAVRNRLGIHSLSDIFWGIGKWIGGSVAQGTLDSIPGAEIACNMLGDASIGAVTDSIQSGAPKAMDALIDGVDLSKPENVSAVTSNLKSGFSTSVSNVLGTLSSLGQTSGSVYANGFMSKCQELLGNFSLGSMFEKYKPDKDDDAVLRMMRADTAKSEKEKREADKKAREEQEKGLVGGTPSGGSGGKGGGKSSKAVEEVVDITKYAAEEIEYFKMKLMEADETLSETEAYDMATEKVRNLAEHIWELNASEEDLALEGAEREKSIKKSFEAWEDSSSDAVGGSIDLLQEFTRQYDRTIKEMNKSIKSNYEATAEYMRYMKLGADFMPEDTWNYFKDQGVDAIDDLRAYMMGSLAEQKVFDQDMFGWDDKAKKDQMELLELQDKVSDRAQRMADGVSDAEDEMADATARATAKMSAAAEEQILLFREIAESASQALGSISDLFGDFNEWEDKTYDNILDGLKKQDMLFARFNDSVSYSASDMLDNMRSQLDGMAEWSSDMNKLGQRGLADGLMQKLSDMGLEGYQYVKAYSEMTDDEIKQANAMFAQIKPAQEAAAGKVSNSFIHQFEQNIETEMDKVIDRMEEFAETISDLLADGFDPKYLKEAIDSGLLSITNFEVFAENADAIQDNIAKIFDIKDETKQNIENQGKTVGNALATGVESGTAQASAEEVAKSITEGITNAISSGTVNINESGKLITDGISNGIIQNEPNVINSSIKTVAESMDAANSTVTNPETGSYRIGWNMSAGMAEGILAGKSMVIEAAIDVAIAAIEAAEEELDINSPSKVFEQIGIYSDMGYANGLYSSKDQVIDASKDVVGSAINAAKNLMTTIQDILNGNIDLDPTIRPVLDLSDIEEKSQSIGKLFSGFDYRLNNSVDIARRTANSMNARKNYSDDVNNDIPSGTNFTFTQNNYSPKALSRTEIYRQTNNQFSRMKGLIGV